VAEGLLIPPGKTHQLQNKGHPQEGRRHRIPIKPLPLLQVCLNFQGEQVWLELPAATFPFISNADCHRRVHLPLNVAAAAQSTEPEPSKLDNAVLSGIFLQRWDLSSAFLHPPCLGTFFSIATTAGRHVQHPSQQWDR